MNISTSSHHSFAPTVLKVRKLQLYHLIISNIDPNSTWSPVSVATTAHDIIHQNIIQTYPSLAPTAWTLHSTWSPLSYATLVPMIGGQHYKVTVTPYAMVYQYHLIICFNFHIYNSLSLSPASEMVFMKIVDYRAYLLADCMYLLADYMLLLVDCTNLWGQLRKYTLVLHIERVWNHNYTHCIED